MPLNYSSASGQKATYKHRAKNKRENKREKQKTDRNQILAIRVEERYSCDFGRVMLINNPKEPNPYYIVHSWNDEDHRSYRIEPKRFQLQYQAEDYLYSLVRD